MSHLLLTAFVATLLSSAAVVAFMARRHGWRWGTLPGSTVHVGAGAFRGAPTRSDDRARGVPPIVLFATGGGFVWAALTFFVFSPAGLLLATILADRREGLPSIALGLVCIDGFAIAAALVLAAVSLLRCRPGAHTRARRVAGWSAAHHAAVLGWFACAALAEGELAILGWVSIPCLLGLGHAVALFRAGTERPPVVLHRS